MSFIYFPQNSLTILPQYAFLQNYQPHIDNFMIGYPEQYSQLLPWNSFFLAQNVSIQEKQPSTTRLTSADDCLSQEVVMGTTNRHLQQRSYKPQKKRLPQKKKLHQNISAKKNSQSNIINQFYAYLAQQERSQHLIKRAIHKTIPETEFQQKILSIFYNTIKLINSKRGRKYVNRNCMLNYFTPEDLLENLPQIQGQINNCDCLSIDELCQIFRRGCHGFIKLISLPAIMTSKRITGNSKSQHLEKRRIILKSLMGY